MVFQYLSVLSCFTMSSKKKRLFYNGLKFKLGFGLYHMVGVCESYALGDVGLETIKV